MSRARIGRPTMLACVVASLPATLAAQDAAPRRMTVTGDVGFVSASGNTSMSSLSLGDRLTIRVGAGAFIQTAALVYGRTAGEETANNQQLRLRYDYPLTARLAVYGFGGYERNRYGGIARRLDESAGLLWRVLQARRDSLGLEAGAGLVQESLYLDDAGSIKAPNDYPSARGAAIYKHLFTGASYFQQLVEYLPSLENGSAYRLNSESAVVAPISRHIGLKASAIVRFNNAPPQAELLKTDRLVSVGLQLTY